MSIFSWIKYKFRSSFPRFFFFFGIRKKLIFFNFIFKFFQYTEELSSTDFLHTAMNTVGEKALWAGISAQMNLHFQFHLFKYIFFASCVFQRHVFYLCLCTVTSSICLHNRTFPVMFCALTSRCFHLLCQILCFCIKREKQNHCGGKTAVKALQWTRLQA